jgi:hypothetical protein
MPRHSAAVNADVPILRAFGSDTTKAPDWVARLAGSGKQAVIRFVQSYRMGYVRVWEWPLRNDLACVKANSFPRRDTI